MTRLLSLVGLMRVSEHEMIVAYSQGMEKAACETAGLWEAKYKQAVADLEKQAGEMRVTDGLLTDAQMEAMELRHEIECLKSTFNQRLADAVQDYQADALAMRRKRQMDRDRRKKS